MSAIDPNLAEYLDPHQVTHFDREAREHRQWMQKLRWSVSGGAEKIYGVLDQPELAFGIFPYWQSGIGLIYGQWGSFKSTVASALAHALQNWQTAHFLGKPYLARPFDAGGEDFFPGSAYLALEDCQNTESRLSLWSMAGETIQTIGSNRPIIFSGGVNLRDPKCVHDLASLLYSEGTATSDAIEAWPHTLFIDTATKAGGPGFSHKDERHVPELLDGTDLLRRKMQAAFAWLVTHAGKDQSAGVRGASEWADGADIILLVERTNRKENRGRIVIEKDRFGGREGTAIPFEVDYRTMTLKDDDGDPFEASVPFLLPVTPAAKPLARGEHQKAIVQHLTEHGEQSTEQLAEAIRQAMPDVKSRHRMTRFREALDALVANKVVARSDGKVSLSQPDRHPPEGGLIDPPFRASNSGLPHQAPDMPE